MLLFNFTLINLLFMLILEEQSHIHHFYNMIKHNNIYNVNDQDMHMKVLHKFDWNFDNLNS